MFEEFCGSDELVRLWIRSRNSVKLNSFIHLHVQSTNKRTETNSQSIKHSRHKNTNTSRAVDEMVQNLSKLEIVQSKLCYRAKTFIL